MKSGNVMQLNHYLPFDPEFLATQQGGRAARRSRSRTGPRTAVGAPGFLSVRRAAEALGIRPRSVIYLIQRGLLLSTRLGRSHFLAVAEVERYQRLRRERRARARARRPRNRGIRLVR